MERLKPLGASNALSSRHALAIVAIGVVVALTIGLAGLLHAKLVTRLDNVFLDAFLKYSIADRPARDTVVIDIDDVSLAAVGQWPWPRYRMAALIRRVADQKPLAIGLDVLMPEPDRSSLVNIQRTFKRDFGVDVTIGGVPDGLQDNDGYLGYEMARAGVVGAHYFYFDHVNQTDVPFDAGLHFPGPTRLPSLPVASGLLLNAGEIASQTRFSGFVNNQIDDDGVLRRLPMLIQRDGIVYPHLSLATVMRSMGVSTGTIESDDNGFFVRVGAHRVPVDEAGFTTLRFNGNARAYPAIPAVDILNGHFRAADLAGKIVFIGSSAVGLNDVHNTALDPRFPGLKVQAVMAESIVNDDFVTTPSWSTIATFIECVVVAALMTALFIVTSGICTALVGSALIVCTLFLVGVLPYARAGLFVSPGAPIVAALTLFVLFFVTRFAIEKRRSLRWHRQLENARQVTMESMASVAETRDPETGAHIKRTQHYVRAIADALKRRGLHLDVLTKEYIDLLFISAPLHDIGKVGVPDHILLKPGRLTVDEFELMKQHAEFGRKIIFSTAQRIDGDNFLVIAGEIAGTHHEKWDGTGYPAGLAGEAIPLSGRIMAVADVYDALISRRCYKQAFPHATAMALMREARGTIFDPVVVDTFFQIEATIQAIALRFSDEAGAVAEVAASTPAHDALPSRLPGWSMSDRERSRA